MNPLRRGGAWHIVLASGGRGSYNAASQQRVPATQPTPARTTAELMAKDKIGDRFDNRREASERKDRAQRGRSDEDIEAERQAIADAGKGEPIRADAAPGRNDPCPCGSGKKYKKCCALKA